LIDVLEGIAELIEECVHGLPVTRPVCLDAEGEVVAAGARSGTRPLGTASIAKPRASSDAVSSVREAS
jgi:hypothetical protein